MPLLDHFPKELSSPRPKQIEVLNLIDKQLSEGTKIFMVNAPVGSGKSAIGITLANYFKSAWVLTPKIALQFQYRDTFKEVKLLRGRKWYPCSYENKAINDYVIPLIKDGKHFRTDEGSSCSGAKCTKKPSKKKQQILDYCATFGPCPYTTAIETASKSDIIVSNYHAFAAQNLYNPAMFGHRKVIVLDEAHSLVHFLRDTLTMSYTIHRMVYTKEVEHLKTFAQWVTWLKRDEQLNTFQDTDSRDAYKARIEKLEGIGENVYGNPVITKTFFDHEKELFKVELIPANVGGAAKALIYDYADVIVLMSGSWHGKEISCWEIGLDPALVSYINIPSDFPAENRPVVLPRDKTLDLSHKNWETNLPKLGEHINQLMLHHQGEKGLIHVNSYTKAFQIAKTVNSDRLIVHTSDDFSLKYKEFIESDPKEGKIFISPSCVEGISLDDDLCRWQILTTLPYPSCSDGYYAALLAKGGWHLYNTHTLRSVSQMCGRIVRSSEDRGISYALDSRFTGFLSKMSGSLDMWFKKGLVK